MQHAVSRATTVPPSSHNQRRAVILVVILCLILVVKPVAFGKEVISNPNRSVNVDQYFTMLTRSFCGCFSLVYCGGWQYTISYCYLVS